MTRTIFLTFTSGLALSMAGCNAQTATSRNDAGAAASESAAMIDVDAAHANDPQVDPELWPEARSPLPRDPAMEARINELLASMTLEEKVGQVIQADISAVTPDEVRAYNLGSVLNGGNSAPGNDNYAPPAAWLALADAYFEASTDTSDGGVGIPTLWGTDAVHGHNNIVGATLFPHNIGLGAANDPDLIREIGAVTAAEVRVTGQEWTFAPTLAVVRDDRWGRTYEGYSESPELVARYASAMVEGLQGRVGDDAFLSDSHVIATAKHFLGDGGTERGVDQGDNRANESDLAHIHGAGYPPAINAGVQTVMASFNSWHGIKMHGNEAILTDVLVDRMGFDGFVVGDWNGHGQVDGCTPTDCAASFNAGLDMFMAPDSWRDLHASLLQQVNDGEISLERLDEAVGRILRVKLRLGLLDAPRPSERGLSGQVELIGSDAHRAVARRAVRQSLVLLKNDGGVLPIAGSANILVAGTAADSIAQQSGGWTINWQGEGNDNADFPGGQSVFAGIAEAMAGAGGTASYSATGDYADRPDVAVVVFGEEPYAEFQGDRADLDFDDDAGLTLLRRYQAEGIPTVAVFLSGRPMWMNPELNASDAFVAAWLPGSEGGGIADVLIGDAEGGVRHDFTGRLSFSWPSTPDQSPLNVGDAGYSPLWPLGYGLDYASQLVESGLLDESYQDRAGQAAAGLTLISSGRAQGEYELVLHATGDEPVRVDGSSAALPGGALRVRSADRFAQEDVRIISWEDAASFSVDGPVSNLVDAAADGMGLSIVYLVNGAPADQAELVMRCGVDCEGAVNVTQGFDIADGKGWREAVLPLSCFADAGADLSAITTPFEIRSGGALEVWVSDVRLRNLTGSAACEL